MVLGFEVSCLGLRESYAAPPDPLGRVQASGLIGEWQGLGFRVLRFRGLGFRV